MTKHTSSDELKEKIMFDAEVTVATKDPEVVRNKSIVKMPLDELMQSIEAHISKHYILKADVVEAKIKQMELLYWLYKEKKGQSVDAKFAEAFGELKDQLRMESLNLEGADNG